MLLAMPYVADAQFLSYLLDGFAEEQLMADGKYSSDWTDEDVEAYVDGCTEAQVNPLHALGVMFSESNAHAEAHNPGGDATGLIQFMPQTRANMGFKGTWQAFAALGVAGQLPYFTRYLKTYRGQLTSPSRVYVAVFLPACLTWPRLNELSVITSSSGPFSFAYLPNKVFDREGKGYITMGDLSLAIDRASKGARWLELSERVSDVMKGRETDPAGTMVDDAIAGVTEDDAPVFLLPSEPPPAPEDPT